MQYLVKKMENAAVRCTTTFNLFYSSNCFIYLLTVQATCGLFSYYLELCFFTSKSYTKYQVTMIQLLTPKQTRAGESAGACVVFRYHSCLWTQHCQYNYLLIIFFRLSFYFQISGLEKKKLEQILKLYLCLYQRVNSRHTPTRMHINRRRRKADSKKKEKAEGKESEYDLIA